MVRQFGPQLVLVLSGRAEQSTAFRNTMRQKYLGWTHTDFTDILQSAVISSLEFEVTTRS